MIHALRVGDPDDIGGYRVIARLGAGGMGEVFLGRSASGRLVAIKVVRAGLSDDPDFRMRFRREVDASRRVSAFHTAAVVAADAAATPAWMVTEYIPGPSLEEAVRQQGPFPVDALKVLGAGLAEALEAIHTCGLIHRDLKPSNILLAEDGPRVIDFGIVRATEGATLTQTGYMVGSVGFLSPEQLLAERLTPAADVFALGAVLCAAAGLAPFGGGSAQAMLYRVVHTQPDLAGMPSELHDLVASCLVKDPTKRPGPMDLVHALSTGPTGHWLPEGVLSSIAERREHAQQVALRAMTGGVGTGPKASPFAPAAGPSHRPSGSSDAPSSVESVESVESMAWMDRITGVTGPGSRAIASPETELTETEITATGLTAAGAVDDTQADDAVAEPEATDPGVIETGATETGVTETGVTARPQVPATPFRVPNGADSRVPPPPPSIHGSYPRPSPMPPPGSWPPVYGPYPPTTPPAGTRLDRLPGGRRVWLTAIIATVLAVLGGVGVVVAHSLSGGGDTRSTSGLSPGTSTDPVPHKGGTLRVSINADSRSLDPCATWYDAFGDGQRMAALYDPLVVFVQSTGKVEPHLAKSLTSTPDGYTWTLELRPDVRFSDGTPLDAEAVRFNWQRHGDPAVKSVHANAVRGLTMRVVSPTRLDITLPAPDMTFDHLIADELAYIGSPTAIRADPQGFGKRPVGAGPFTLANWIPGEKQVFVRNPDYWQGPDRPLLDSLEFVVSAEQPVAPVIEGSADVNFQSSNRDLQQARSAGLELVPTAGPGAVMLGFNATSRPFDDPRARKAVSLALDAEALAKDTGATLKPTRTVVPSTSPLRTDALPQQPGRDAAKAQALFDELSEAGKPLSFTVLAGEGEQRAMEAIQTQLSRFRNVEMDFRAAAPAEFGDRIAKRDFDAVWAYESGADLDTWLYAITRGGYDANYLGYRDATVDRAWTTVRGATSPQAKSAGYVSMFQALADDPPWWLYAEIPIYAVQREGAVTGLDGAYADGILRWDRVGRK